MLEETYAMNAQYWFDWLYAKDPCKQDNKEQKQICHRTMFR